MIYLPYHNWVDQEYFWFLRNGRLFGETLYVDREQDVWIVQPDLRTKGSPVDYLTFLPFLDEGKSQSSASFLNTWHTLSFPHILTMSRHMRWLYLRHDQVSACAWSSGRKIRPYYGILSTVFSYILQLFSIISSPQGSSFGKQQPPILLDEHYSTYDPLIWKNNLSDSNLIFFFSIIPLGQLMI